MSHRDAARHTILVTGAASGIGLATARRMAATMNVVAADIDAKGAAVAAGMLNANGGSAIGVEADVTDRASVLAMVEAARQRFGPIHALFNNAGVTQSGPTTILSEAEWDRVVDTHAKGTFLCTQAVLPDMIAEGGGAVVNMASIYAVRGMASGGAYAAAKAAIVSMTKALALEFVDQNIRINAVGPGPIDTPLLRGSFGEGDWSEWKVRRIAQLPLGRLGTPDDVASVVGFLLSDRASYITGQLLLVDGGQVTW